MPPRRWKVLVAAPVGVSLGLTALPFYTIGLFVQPTATSLGRACGTAESGLVLSMAGTVPVALFVG